MKGHPYNHSSTGDFALKPYGPGRSNPLSRDRPAGGGTDHDSQSEEITPARFGSQRSILDGEAKKGIMMRQEFSVKVTDASSPSPGQVAPFSQV